MDATRIGTGFVGSNNSSQLFVYIFTFLVVQIKFDVKNMYVLHNTAHDVVTTPRSSATTEQDPNDGTIPMHT